MANETTRTFLNNKIQSLFKSVYLLVDNFIYNGTNLPSEETTLRRIKFHTYLKNNRRVLFFKSGIQNPIYTEIGAVSKIPTQTNVAAICNQDYGNDKAIYIIRLEAASINSTTMILTLDSTYTSYWNNSELKHIDESLSYFINTSTGTKISFNSMYNKGMLEVSMITDAVKLTFDGTDLTQWKAVIFAKYERS